MSSDTAFPLILGIIFVILGISVLVRPRSFGKPYADLHDNGRRWFNIFGPGKPSIDDFTDAAIRAGIAAVLIGIAGICIALFGHARPN